MAKTTVDITTTKTPATDSAFSEQKINATSGPIPVLASNVSLEANAVAPAKPQNAAVWKPMTKFDEGLKIALTDFVDVTMEGVKYQKNFQGRSKEINFFFYGTSTKAVRPSEVGNFKLVISYPPNVSNTNTNTSNV